MPNKHTRGSRGGTGSKHHGPAGGAADDARQQPHAARAPIAQPGQQRKRKRARSPGHAAAGAAVHGRADGGDHAAHPPRVVSAHQPELQPVAQEGSLEWAAAPAVSAARRVCPMLASAAIVNVADMYAAVRPVLETSAAAALPQPSAPHVPSLQAGENG